MDRSLAVETVPLPRSNTITGSDPVTVNEKLAVLGSVCPLPVISMSYMYVSGLSVCAGIVRRSDVLLGGVEVLVPVAALRNFQLYLNVCAH
jgi:hypothetical protein